MLEESSSKRITRGSIARARADEELRSKQRNENVTRTTSSKKKRKVDDIAFSSGGSEKNGHGSDSGDRDEIGEGNQKIQYLLKGTPIVHQHMQCYTNVNAIDDLKKILTESQMRRFRETSCFSHLLDLNQCDVQAQIFRALMMLEVHGSSSDVFVIRVDGSTLRFTRREFALISGLKCCDESSDFVFNTEEPNRLMRQYFGDTSRSINKQQLVSSCMNKVWGDNDDDALKFATLFFIHSFIMSEEPSSTLIERKDFDLVILCQDPV